MHPAVLSRAGSIDQTDPQSDGSVKRIEFIYFVVSRARGEEGEAPAKGERFSCYDIQLQSLRKMTRLVVSPSSRNEKSGVPDDISDRVASKTDGATFVQ